jgi:flavin reductase (DIM6/NTAB) family NADH-FMN oxidoreductase RutF
MTAMAPIDPTTFRAALGRFASGVTVLTTRAADGTDLGMTATAFTSVSLAPPLILVCVDHDASAVPALTIGAAFAVHILAESQTALSRRFASSETDRFAGLAIVRGLNEVPLLDGVLARLECRVTATYPGGDHRIVVGEVHEATLGEAGPLLYFRGGYGRLTPTTD